MLSTGSAQLSQAGKSQECTVRRKGEGEARQCRVVFLCLCKPLIDRGEHHQEVASIGDTAQPVSWREPAVVQGADRKPTA